MTGSNARRRRSTRASPKARAQDWQNLYNPANGFIEPKMANGQFVSDFDPTSQNDYVEGDAYQYRWMVPFNLRALVAAERGNADFTRRLATYFTKLNAGPESPYYWAGNEPNLGDAWEFDYAGAPYRTQATVRKLINSLYSDSPGGEPGNDDLGAMSSWYAWAALVCIRRHRDRRCSSPAVRCSRESSCAWPLASG
jgi:putative alpha-1,2-mannosidase